MTVTSRKEGALHPRQENEHTHHEKTFAHHGKNCTTVSRQHSTAPCIKPRSLSKYAFWDFQGPTRPPLQNEYSQLLPTFIAQIAWEYAFRDFQGPKMSTSSCSPIKAQIAWEPDHLSVRILELSRAQTPKMCTPSCSPHQNPDRLGVRILGLSKAQHPNLCNFGCSPRPSQDAPKLPKCVLPAASPLKAQMHVLNLSGSPQILVIVRRGLS